ncbi:MAG: CpsB/CapC family capsule biosynthesis tyrosine phosphatase [Acidobacteriota bacterium]
MKFVDIHSHILPGIDDGPPSLEAALQMLRLAYRTGTRAMVATPHMFMPPYNNCDRAAVSQVFSATVQQLRQRQNDPGCAFLGDMSLHLGAENYLSPEFLEALEDGRVLSLNQGFYILVEFPAFLAFEMVVSAMERILASGRVPIMAHVERYPQFSERPEALAHLLQMGCVAQLNGATVLSSRAHRKFALSLLRQGLIHVIASDAHDSRVRAPNLDKAFKVLKREFKEHQVNEWMFDNPRRILANQSLI